MDRFICFRTISGVHVTTAARNLIVINSGEAYSVGTIDESESMWKIDKETYFRILATLVVVTC